MQIGHIQGATRVIGKQQGYLGLPVRDELINCKVNGESTPVMTTAWLPTPDEIERINAGAAIYLQILGTAHPPVIMQVGEAPR